MGEAQIACIEKVERIRDTLKVKQKLLTEAINKGDRTAHVEEELAMTKKSLSDAENILARFTQKAPA
ncbi:hypothetical protein KW797_02880 [Candidatus Parcubacteria bacterium]|nr:hypothetical protein [Candidatus Parcubacteria bacterium]